MQVSFWWVPIFFQSTLILVDEFYCHRRRFVPRWERIGHPIDTLSVLACVTYALFFEFTSVNMLIYALLAGASCLLITKDEWVHREHCSGFESWVHAMLFILHPLVLFSFCIFWYDGKTDLLKASAWALTAYMSYQTIYWNFVFHEPANKN